ncbi:ATPase [Mycobacterium sp. pUA109]|uniref:ATPase n=1 Tax=Mycobacterium sp. pUA109 TaxID=3238982 RepID=UPI00351BDA98
MRVIMATLLIVGGFATAPVSGAPAHAEPQTCPTLCDQIPNSAWIDPAAVPLNAVYHWPAPAGAAAAVTGTPRFRFEQLCASAPVPQDPRDYVVASRAVLDKPEGQWQLQAQVLHWRGETWRTGQLAASVFNAARTALRGCQRGAPEQSPSLTTDEPNRLAAVISGPVVMHTYLAAQQSSTISELTLWSSAPPQVPWPVIDDAQVLDALVKPLCTAYLDSCH